MKAIKKKVIRHLKEDRKAWLKLSKEAKKEAQSDKSLIRKIRKVC